MNIPHVHDWNLTPQAAMALQQRLALQIVTGPPLPLERVRLVAGVDVGVKDDISQAAVVVVTFPDLEIVETVTVARPTPFPYIPGLLTFREGPVLEEAFNRLAAEPDVFLFDGMGIMHPRRLGIAAHMGLWLDRPTIGCGKTHLVGTYTAPDDVRGARSLVRHRGDVIGVVLRTRVGVKPVYISPGNRIDLESAVTIALACTPRYRLPEPIRMAHNAAGRR
jgi:deoxyribonuclease V